MQLFLSDSAFEGLVKIVRYTGHIRGQTKNRGLNTFMSGLLQQNPTPDSWKDTRPENIKAQDLPGLEGGRLPIWDDGDTRFSRLIKIEPTIEPELARQLGIIKQHPMRKFPSFSDASLTSEFWEAIGIGWLTAVNEPTGPDYKTNRLLQTSTELEF